MNKDIYYIEPEDDITDIINHLKSSKQKVIALVPPKKLSVMRSAINLKLIAKTAKNLDKAVVIVTLDPVLMKLAAVSGLPFAKNLQSRPVLPSEYKDAPVSSKPSLKDQSINEVDEVVEESEQDAPQSSKPADTQTAKKVETKNVQKGNSTLANKSKVHQAEELDSNEFEQDSDENNEKTIKKIPAFDSLRKWIILGVALLIVLVIGGIWAFVLAPAAKIMVKIKTTPDNFSENITLVTAADQSNNKEGKILLESESLEKESSIEFEATGERNDGEKASGKLTLTANFSFSTSSASPSNPDRISVPIGSAFAKGNLNYLTIANTDFSWDGSTTSCTVRTTNTCQIRKTVDVVAFEGGTRFNIDPAASGWQSSVEKVDAFNSSAFTGGTDKIVKIVTASDVEKAKNQASQIDEGKDELFTKVKETELKIDASYKKTLGDAVPSPAVGEVAAEGKAKLLAKITYKVNVLDKSAVEEYIRTLVSSRLGEDQKIYEIGSLFIERFQENNTASAKLKAIVKTGPEVTEKTVLDKSLGKKIGEVTTLIKSINGVSEVKVDTSFPWVRSIPEDINKVSVTITIEEN